MKVLFIAPEHPTVQGGRSHQFLRSLAAGGHAVTLVCQSTLGPEADNVAANLLSEYCSSVHTVPFSRSEALVQCAKYLATSTPLWPASHFSSALEMVIDQLITEEEFDVAHVSDLRCARFGRRINGRVPVVYDTEYCVSEVDSQVIDESNLSSFGQFFSRKEQAKLRGYEPRMANLFDRVITSTVADQRALEALGRKVGVDLGVDVIPNGVDLDVYQPVTTPTVPGNIVLSGKIHYEANRDAAYYFASEVIPGVRQAHPACFLTLVGAVHVEGTHYAVPIGPGIEVAEDTADIRIPFARGSIIVCPVREGIGVKTNVLEAMAMGKAVVATPLGIRSLHEPSIGDSICVADTPLSFATQLVHLLSHPEEVARLGKNARIFVEERHDWVTLGDNLISIYEEVIEENAAVAVD